jgi:hypothetical protein
MRNILFLSLALLSCMVAGEAATIPKDIAPVLTAYESEAKRAWDAYQTALQKAEDKVKKDLNAKMAAAIKKVDLDTANAIKAQLERVTSGEAVNGYEVAWKAAKNDKDMLGDNTAGLVILEATWGVPGKTADVTEIIKKQVKDNKLTFVHADDIFRGLFASIPDPVPSGKKTVTIKYIYNGVANTAIVADRDSIKIPSK